MAACPGRAPGCYRNDNPNNKFLCNICAQRLSLIPAGVNPERPDESGTDAIVKVAQMFDSGDSSGYQAIFASWLPVLRSWTPPE